MNLFWLLRMKRWAQNPRGKKMLLVVAVVVVASFLIYGFEQLFGWPDWLTVNKARR